jgi:peptidoglycan/LPS O-acetylase OafA/YrhL
MVSTSGPVKIQHLPALDGLRGLAVLGVLLFHDDRLRGGYLGVDLFFVLSGYLITSLLLAEWKRARRIDLRAFWVRRARRLFPALLALLVGVAAYAAVFAAPSDRARIRGDGVATLGYVANWHTILQGKSYWDLFTAPSPLEHTWSLAIEEQFYVMWPLLVLGVLRASRGSTRLLLGVVAALAAASASAMWFLYSPETASRVYQGTDTRGAAILAGAGLACALSVWGTLQRAWAVRALDVLGLVSAGGLGAAWWWMDGQSDFLYQGGFWLTELAVLGLIACAAHGERSVVARVLAFRPLTWIGLISYGVYLWHWPLYLLLSHDRTGLDGVALTVVRLAATFALSVASFFLLEQPIRKRGIRWGRPVIVVPSAAVAVLAVLLVSTVPTSAAVGQASQAQVAASLRALPAASAVPESATRVLVLGDSVAVALGERLHAVSQGADTVIVDRGVGDCSLLEGVVPMRSLNNRAHDGGNCAAHWESDVREVRPDVTLLVLGGGFFARGKLDGRWQRACDASWRKAYGTQLHDRLEAIQGEAGRLVLTVVPYPVGHWVKANPKKLVDCFNDIQRGVAAKLAGVSLLDLQQHLCGDGDCALSSGGAPIRPDGVHFDGPGAEEVSRWVLATLPRRERVQAPPPPEPTASASGP